MSASSPPPSRCIGQGAHAASSNLFHSVSLVIFCLHHNLFFRPPPLYSFPLTSGYHNNKPRTKIRAAASPHCCCCFCNSYCLFQSLQNRFFCQSCSHYHCWFHLYCCWCWFIYWTMPLLLSIVPPTYATVDINLSTTWFRCCLWFVNPYYQQ